MELDARYAWVGLIVILLLGGAISLGLWLAYGDDEQNLRFYKILIEDQSLAGLDVNSTVTMRGIRVGHVQRLRILPKQEQGVEVIIGVSPDAPVTSSMRAVVDRNLLTGLASVDLRHEDKEEGEAIIGPELNLDGSIPENLPRIEEGQVPLTQFTETAASIMQRLSATLEALQSFITEENQQRISNILVNIEEVSGELARNKNGISKFIENSEKASLEFAELLREIRNSISSVSEEFGSTARVVKRQMNSISVLSTNLNEKIANAAEPLDSPQEILFGTNPADFGPGETAPQ